MLRALFLSPCVVQVLCFKITVLGVAGSAWHNTIFSAAFSNTTIHSKDKPRYDQHVEGTFYWAP